MSIQSIVFTVLIMVLKVEHPLVDDCGFHDGNSASLRSVQLNFMFLMTHHFQVMLCTM